MTSLTLDLSCVEARGLALGLRRAWRLRLPAGQLQRWQQAFANESTVMAVSPSVYAPLDGGVLRRGHGQDAVHLVVIAVDEATARDCLEHEMVNADRDEGDDSTAWAATVAAHRRVGRAYGYPDCCVSAFCDGWLEAMAQRPRVLSDNALLILRAHLRSRAWHPLLRAFGAGLGEQTSSPLRHLPCRFDCPQSVALAEAIVTDLRSSNPSQAALYEPAPVRPTVVDADGSVAELPAGETCAAPACQAPAAGVEGRFPLVLPFAW